jgi:integrase
VSIHKVRDGLYKIRWREGGRNRSLNVHGSHELAKKVLRKKLSARDENRHLDVKREVNFRVSALVDRYREQYAKQKKSWDREKSVLNGINKHFGNMFVREMSGAEIDSWYRSLMTRGLEEGTAARHFNVIHHMMAKASTIWSKETGMDRNPADEVEVKRPDDRRERYLEREEIGNLKATLDEKMYRKAGNGINETFFRLRLIVLVALTTGMRIAEIFGLKWSDIRYQENLIAVGAKLKGGEFRYVPMPPELAAEFRRYPAVFGEERIFPPEPGAKRERQRVDKSFTTILKLAGINDFRFHDLRHTFASWYMMNGGDLYELAKILGHANIKMTERYAKLARSHIAKTGGTAREMWRMLEGETRNQVKGTA